MEVALRTAYEFVTKEETPDTLYELDPVRGMEEMREATLNIGDLTLNVAVIYGTNNVRKMMDKLKTSEKQYHFIEVMTCPGGSIGGGGQTKHRINKIKGANEKRIMTLYNKDSNMKLRLSHKNPEIVMLYDEFYGKPLSVLAEKMLHTSFYRRSSDLEEI